MSASDAARILELLGPTCRDDRRRQRLIEASGPNGIDFVEYEKVAGVHVLHVHFLKPLSPGAYGLLADPSPLQVHGGTRIVDIKVVGVALDGSHLDVRVGAQGDFSPYLLTVGWTATGGVWSFQFADIDRQFSAVLVNFRPDCPVDFDCLADVRCPEDALAEPSLDYLARDYASFRQLLIDLVAQRNPSWTERSPADLGMTLLELFAHEGDHHSYFQDAVANEAFLDTARQRVSARRHARLVDYRMHDGRNAWTHVHFTASTNGTLRAGSQLVTRIRGLLRFDREPGVTPTPQPTAPPATLLHPVLDEDWRTDPALAQVRVFETVKALAVHPENNELRLHAWGNDTCCLPRGATSAHVYSTDGNLAIRPILAAGDLLLLEERRSPTTGAEADADPTHRQVVRIVRVDPALPLTAGLHDPLFLRALDPDGEPLELVGSPPIDDTLPLVEVVWAPENALTFSLCLAARLTDGTRVRCSLARGNIAIADHGRSLCETHTFVPPLDSDALFRLQLEQGPLTMRIDPNRIATAPHGPPGAASPAIALTVTSGASARPWSPEPDLLDSDEFDEVFVAEVGNDGRGVLRFGDGEYGQRLTRVDAIEAAYRVGNGRSGNIGAESLAHLVVPHPKPPMWPAVVALRNPLAAQDGEDPESIEAVRQRAPGALQAYQGRAVTEQDYRDAALRISGVAGAVANFRWTGSWYTVFVGIDPEDQGLVLTDARGVTQLEPEFRIRVHDVLTRSRLAGYDLEIRSARYVPLDVSLHVCVRRGYFRGDVVHALSLALGADFGPDGVPGLFHPARFTFGQSVHLSHIYARVVAVAGVESARVTAFHRRGRAPAGELEAGRLAIGPWEIARLDNSRSNMENGTLTITAGGGS